MGSEGLSLAGTSGTFDLKESSGYNMLYLVIFVIFSLGKILRTVIECVTYSGFNSEDWFSGNTLCPLILPHV